MNGTTSRRWPGERAMGFADDFVRKLQGLTFDNVFNPYADTCPTADLPGAPERRSETLLSVIEAAQRQDVREMWIGRDLGHRGGRRTGLPFTDDARLTVHCERWGVPVRPATHDWVTEPTASAVWQALDPIRTPVFLWNVFPLHPHDPGSPLSNRSHSREEREAGVRLLNELLAAFRPRRLVAIGNDAYGAVKGLADEVDVRLVRHPSHGGRPQFLWGIRGLHPEVVT